MTVQTVINFLIAFAFLVLGDFRLWHFLNGQSRRLWQVSENIGDRPAPTYRVTWARAAVMAFLAGLVLGTFVAQDRWVQVMLAVLIISGGVGWWVMLNRCYGAALREQSGG